jgi:hypothetical protein
MDEEIEAATISQKKDNLFNVVNPVSVFADYFQITRKSLAFLEVEVVFKVVRANRRNM